MVLSHSEHFDHASAHADELELLEIYMHAGLHDHHRDAQRPGERPHVRRVLAVEDVEGAASAAAAGEEAMVSPV